MNTTKARKGDWFQTHSGIQFFPCDPRPEDVNIDDIAHGLARICRFGGHTRDFYSVAQHSVIVCDILPDELKLAGLLHDATEAYIGDMVRPLKYQIPQYRMIEKQVWFAISLRFNLPPELPELVKHADNVALITERRDVLEVQRALGEWTKAYEPLSQIISPMSPVLAETVFLTRFHQLIARYN